MKNMHFKQNMTKIYIFTVATSIIGGHTSKSKSLDQVCPSLDINEYDKLNKYQKEETKTTTKIIHKLSLSLSVTHIHLAWLTHPHTPTHHLPSPIQERKT